MKIKRCMRCIVLVICLICTMAGIASAAKLLIQNDKYTLMKKARQKAAYQKRHLIVNNDGNDAPANPVTAQSFLAQRTAPLADTVVDAIFYCDGVFNLYSHKSQISETKEDHYKKRKVKNWIQQLHQQGHEPLQLVIDFGKSHNIEVFWSMRMNDTHDASPNRIHLVTNWKARNRHLCMAPEFTKFPYGWFNDWSWSSLNFEHAEVREKAFRILEDVCSRYDIDGVELDFFRHPVFFKPQVLGEPVTQAHCDIMTNLLERVRKMTEEVSFQRGRPFLIAVRIPDSVGYAKAIGLDLITWLQKDLVDLVVGGGNFQLQQWKQLVDAVKPYHVPVYAAFDRHRMPEINNDELIAASRSGGTNWVSKTPNLAAWRGEALRAWEDGVDGIYLFNMFNPKNPLMNELANPNLLKTLPISYKYSLTKHNRTHIEKIRTLVKNGEVYFDTNIMSRWEPPLPAVFKNTSKEKESRQ